MIKHIVTPCLSICLIACGGSGSSKTPDTEAPTATINFPTATSLTDADNVTVYGVARDASEITYVKVNGVDATTSDNFSSWKAIITLDVGNNDITVTTADVQGNENENAALVSIKSNPAPFTLAHNIPDNVNPFTYPQHINYDAKRSRLLVVDSTLEAIFAVDENTGARTVLSDATTPNAENVFSSANKIAVDSSNDVAYVSDNGLDAIIEVNLITGARTILSSAIVPNSAEPLISRPTGIAIDNINQRLLVVDRDLDSLIAIDLGDNKGQRSIISDDNTPNSSIPFKVPKDIVLSEDGSLAYIAEEYYDGVLVVDLSTGERTILSDSTQQGCIDYSDPQYPNGAVIDYPEGIDIDFTTGQIVIAEWEYGYMTQVDISDGHCTLIYGQVPTDVRNDSANPRDVILDEERGRAFIVDSTLDAVVVVHIESGDRVILTMAEK